MAVAACELTAIFKREKGRCCIYYLDSFEGGQVPALILPGNGHRSPGDTAQGPRSHPGDYSGSLGSDHKGRLYFPSRSGLVTAAMGKVWFQLAQESEPEGVNY